MSRLGPGRFGAGLLDRVRAGVGRVVRSQLLGAVPVAVAAAEPVPGPLGPAAFRPDGDVGGGPVEVPARWDLESGREAHRHAWFAELARRAAAGDRASGDAAISGLESWLRHDRPGAGVAWEHPSDAAARLVHQAAGFSWLGEQAPPELRAAAAGSATWHITHLQRRLPLDSGAGHRRVAHQSALVVVGLTFPAVPGARTAWSEAATALGPALEELVFADGSDRGGAPRWLETSLWYAAIAQAVARASGVALPGRATAAWARGVRFLDRLSGDLATLPDLGESPPFPLLPAPGSTPAVLRALATHWGLDSGEGVAAPDRRLVWFGAQRSAPPGVAARVATAAASRGGAAFWSAWSFHEDGVAIATLPVRGEWMRTVLTAQSKSGGPLAHAAPLQLLVELGARALLADPGSGIPAFGAHDGLVLHGEAARPGHLDIARVDGKKARLEGHMPLGAGGRWCRDVLLNQQRVRVSDRLEGAGGAVSLRWTIGAEWQVEGAERSWTLRAGPHTVTLELPAGLAWDRDGHAWLGRGTLAPGAELRTELEVR